ncbi:MAG TPA: PAS domain S-box protein [Kouleothrix sp.]|uniref:ATP-binding protein n=1 Tax=Kouleothrix sp. TaxID=2779161 RepID=UPI002B701641|nr:PAS domain S-box protein [Kouleothrix sp.]
MPKQPGALHIRQPNNMLAEHVSYPDTQFQSLLEAAPDAIVIVDGLGAMAIVNQQAEAMFGYSRDELIGQPIEMLLPERLRQRHVHYRSLYADAPRTRPMGSNYQLIAMHKDGREFPTEVSLSPLETEQGLLVISVIRDISERQRAEAALRRQTNFVHLLQEVAVTANQATTVEAALQQAIDQICAHTGWPIGHVYLSDGRDDGLVPTAIWHFDQPGLFEAFQKQTEALRIGPGGGLVGQVLAKKKPAWSILGHDQQFLRARAALESGLHAGFAFPVLVSDEVVAVLEFFSTEAAEPDEALLEVMAHVGTQLGRVVERTRSASELERRVRRRTAHLNALLELSKELLPARELDTLLQRAMSNAMALVPEASCGAIYLYQSSSNRLALRASTGFGQLPATNVPIALGVLGSAFSTRQAQAASSVDEFNALTPGLDDEQRLQLLRALDLRAQPTGVLAIPLVAHEQAVGVLLLLRKNGTGTFAAEARATLEGLASLAAAAILEERSTRRAATLSNQLATLEEQQRALTERLSSAEAAILQAARLAAVGQLAAAIAHEINNPLYAARNCLYLLENELSDRQAGSDYLAIAREQLTRIAGIIQRMRDFYRPARGDLAPANINQLLEDTLALAGLNARDTAIEMIFTPDHTLPDVRCNADQLRQVFLNLVLNAIEAMPDGGTLTVRTVAGQNVALIEIQDTGVGIPDDIRVHLFEPFYTNKPNGTGLGLSISAHIVTQHNGQIEVESSAGAGSTFRVVLPYEP